METRQLGNSGLRLSVLGLGTLTFGTHEPDGRLGTTDVDGARRQLATCLDMGVNWIDTADAYAFGRSEEIVGKVIEGRRDDVLIATKVGTPTGDGPNDGYSSRHHLRRACEKSLRRLNVDHIDLFQLHRWDAQTSIEETLSALAKLVGDGKVNYVGVSNFFAYQVSKVLGLSRLSTYVGAPCPWFVSHQLYYSLQSRHAETEMIPGALAEGLGVLAYSPLAGGLLTGKYHSEQPPPASVRHSTPWVEPHIHDEKQLARIVRILDDVAAKHDTTPAQVALAWVMGRPGVTSVIVGARTDEHLAENLGAADLKLPPEDLVLLDEASALPPTYPIGPQRAATADRPGPVERALRGRATWGG